MIGRSRCSFCGKNFLSSEMSVFTSSQISTYQVPRDAEENEYCQKCYNLIRDHGEFGWTYSNFMEMISAARVLSMADGTMIEDTTEGGVT